MTWTVATEQEPDAAVRTAILDALIEHNVAQVGDGGYAQVAITVRDPSGTVVGGLWGMILHRFLLVELLALGVARGNGMGRRVMAMAEAEARRRGCIGIWLDTFTFQAPWFYPKLGFVEFGRISGYPPGHDRMFLVKRWDNTPADRDPAATRAVGAPSSLLPKGTGDSPT